MSTKSRKLPLRFGIDSFDRLIDPEQDIDSDANRKATWTAAVVGPDGCGKSILSLHLASTYWHDVNADNDNDPPRIIYVSTDLSFGQASGQWKNFGLDFPAWREQSVKDAYENRDRRSPQFDLASNRLLLQLLKPISGDDGKNQVLERLLSNDKDSNAVYFLDLQADTAGDDWEFVNHLVGLLPKRATVNEGVPQKSRHLLIVDAVEGLETLVGDRDAYGQSRDRRSRVAQLIRRAMAIGVHILFVVEESKDDSRLPEQFVTDLVIRLRHTADGQYTQRTVEIEKCRAVAHVRGLHEFCIRPGCGSASGRMVNLNDPQIRWRDNHGQLVFDDTCGFGEGVREVIVKRPQGHSKEEKRLVDSKKPYQYLSHINVIPSLYLQSSKHRRNIARLAELVGQPTFNLDSVDRLLPKPRDLPSRDSGASTSAGCIALLLGETGTYKGRLARRFLSEALRPKSKKQMQDVAGAGLGVAVLLTTRFIDHDQLAARICIHAGITSQQDIDAKIIPRILCHRFGCRHLTAGAFFDIVTRYVQEAQKIVFEKTNQRFSEIPSLKKAAARREQSYRIRVVLEDWNVLLATYPGLKQEPLLLSSILTYFRREGVSCLIVSTQPGQPSAPEPFDANELRSLDETQILTWNVPFYGDRRVAITAYSAGMSHRAPIICELSPDGADDSDGERLVANRHFDLYADVDLGRPHRVPLVVRLYLGNHAIPESHPDKGEFIRLLEDTFTQLFPAPTGQSTVKLDPYTEYGRLFTFATVLDDAHLDHTLVFQVDEFWAMPPTAGQSRQHGVESCLHSRLYDLTYYWRRASVSWVIFEKDDDGGVSDSGTYGVEDTIGAYHPHAHSEDIPPAITPKGLPHFGVPCISSPAIKDVRADYKQSLADNQQDLIPGEMKRHHFFISPADGGPCADPDSPVDRIPYVWDFGMLLADRDLWKRYADMQTGVRPIGSIWNRLCPKSRDVYEVLKLDHSATTEHEEALSDPVSWPEFLHACRKIAELEDIPAFDVDLSTVETLSCWVLELWASYQRLNERDGRGDMFFKNVSRHESGSSGPCLETLVSECGGALYQALVQIVFSCPHLRARNRQVYREHVSSKAVASREWYHTASAAMKKSPDQRLIPLSNCGSFSARGDWSLAVAAGSRSEIVAHRALDLLSSRRNNLLRLQDGIGLPVRDVLPDVHNGDIPTAMHCFNDKEQRSFQLNYRDICSLGRDGRDSDFFWLWRSRIKYYERDCLYWRRWIARMIEEQHLWFPWKLRHDDEAMERLLNSNPGITFSKDGVPETTNIEALDEALGRFSELRNIIRSALRDEMPSRHQND